MEYDYVLVVLYGVLQLIDKLARLEITMANTDFDTLATFWDERLNPELQMERDKVMERIEAFISGFNTCALATGSGDYVRCTPVEFSYFNQTFWIFSEGGHKFIGLKDNKHVSLAIFEQYGGVGKFKGLQVMGMAEMIPVESDEYARAVEHKGLRVEAMRKMNPPINLIKITPTHMDYLDPECKKDGFTSRQAVEF